MKQATAALIFVLALALIPDSARAATTRTVGCARVGYTMDVPASWHVATNCAWATVVEGGNPRFTIRVSTTPFAQLTGAQMRSDCTKVLKTLGKYASSYKLTGSPVSIFVGSRPATYAGAVYFMRDGGNAYVEIYEVFRFKTLFQFLMYADVSGGIKALNTAIAEDNTMIGSVSID